MANKAIDRLFEIAPSLGSEPFEADGLRARTNFQARASRAGPDFKAMALARLDDADAKIERVDFEVDGFPVDALVSGRNGRRFLVLARGTPEESSQSGLRRTDTVEKVGFMAMQLSRRQSMPVLIITSDLPMPNTKAWLYLAALDNDVWDVIGYRGDLRGFQRLRRHLHGSIDAEGRIAPWCSPSRRAI